MGSGKWNWKKLEKDWLKNDYKSLTDFGKQHNIPRGTLAKHSQNWTKTNREIEISAKEKFIKKREEILAMHLDVGKELIEIGMVAAREGNITDKDGDVDAHKGAQVVKIGSEIQARVLLGDEDEQDRSIVIYVDGVKRPGGEIKKN